MPSIKTLRQSPESERLAFIRAVADDLAWRLENQIADEAQARDLVAAVRFQVRLLIPGQMGTYDLIYGARFERLIQQFVRPASSLDQAGRSSPQEVVR